MFDSALAVASPAVGEVLPPSIHLSRQSLKLLPEMVMRDVRDFFDSQDHRPSEGMYEALKAIPKTVVSIILGTAERKYYLCPIDTGVGKTVTLAHTIKWLRANSPWQCLDVGAVVGLERIDQIREMAKKLEALGIGKEEYAAYTADKETNKLGRGKEGAGDAAILLTSHAMIERQIKGRTWGECEKFFYQGKPRLLRLWDEGIEPGRTVTINNQRLYALVGAAPRPEAFGAEIKAFLGKLENAPNGSVIDVPSFVDRYELTTVIGTLAKDDRRKLSDILHDLFSLSGRQASIVRDGYAGNTLVQYELDKTDDMLPMLILDASARVKGTYTLQEKAKGNICRLEGPRKRYRDVTLHVKQVGQGKYSFGKAYHRNIGEIAELIRRYEAHKILLLHPLESERAKVGNVPEDIKRRLSAPQGLIAANGVMPDIAFCSWGRHRASNDYRDCDVIIVASLLHYPESAYHAAARLSADIPPVQRVEEEQYRTVKRGEMLSDLLQALTRGSMRKLDGDQAHPCRVFLPIGDKRLIKLLPKVFPEARIVDGWEEDGEQVQESRKAKGGLTREEQVLEFIHDWFENSEEHLEFPSIYQALKIRQENFSRLIHSPSIRDALEDGGYEVVKARPSYLREKLGTSSEFPESDIFKGPIMKTEFEKHAELVRPFVEKWKDKVEPEVEKRIEKFTRDRRHKPLVWQVQKIREEVERDIPYEGPEPDFDRYRAAKEAQFRRQEEQQRIEAMKDGCPQGYWRTPDGLIRNIETGVIYQPSETQD